MILHTSPEIQAEIERLTGEAFAVFDLENPQTGIDFLIQAYQLLPQPRAQYSESFNLLKYIAIGYFRAGMDDQSVKWVPHFMESDYYTMGYGESEYLAGKVALKRKDEQMAIQHFLVASEKSEGRAFADKSETEYLQFFRANAADSMRPTEFGQMREVALEEIEKGNFRYALSLLYDCLNQQLDNAEIHFHKGICHFGLGEPELAADAFTRSYMLEGELYFESGSPKYLEFLKERIEI